MRAETTLLLRLLRASGPALLVAAILAVAAGLSAVGLVASAGWLITASGLAGLAGVGLEIFFPGAIVRFLAVSRTLSRYGERLLGHAAIFSALARLRSAVFATLAQRPLAALARHNRSLELQRLTREIERLEAWPIRLLLPAVTLASGALLGLILIAVSLGPAAGIAFAMVLATCVYALVRWPRGTELLAQRSALLRRRHGQRVVETLQAAPSLWHLDRRHGRHSDCQRLFDRSRQAQSRLAERANQREASQQLLLGLAALALLTLWPILAPAWHLLAILAVLALANLLPGISFAMADLPGLLSSARAVLPDSDRTPAMQEAPTTISAERAPRLSFADVRINTGWREPALFDAFKWEILPRQWWAVCGPSGCGKSTLARLLAGTQLPAAGMVCIDSAPVTALSDEARLNRLAFLTQETVILADTLRANLLLGTQQTVPDDSLRDALRAVGLGELGMQLDRWVGETGQPLSGGQARRVALLRTVLSDAPGLVLDEPFRGLDDHNRRICSQWLWTAVKGRTLLLLDHAPPLNWPGRVLDVRQARVGGPADKQD